MTDIVLKEVKNEKLLLNLLSSIITTIADPIFMPYRFQKSESPQLSQGDIYNKVILYVLEKLLTTSAENFDAFQQILLSARAIALRLAAEKKQQQKTMTMENNDDRYC